MVRNSMKYAPWGNYKAITGDVKRIYQSVTEEEVLLELDNVCVRWDDKYPQDIRKRFPSDDSAKKVVNLAIDSASKRWTISIRNGKTALNRFMIEFEDRLKDFI